MCLINIFKPLFYNQRRWLTSATIIIFPLNAGNRTLGFWVRSKYATSVLCNPRLCPSSQKNPTEVPSSNICLVLLFCPNRDFRIRSKVAARRPVPLLKHKSSWAIVQHRLIKNWDKGRKIFFVSHLLKRFSNKPTVLSSLNGARPGQLTKTS